MGGKYRWGRACALAGPALLAACVSHGVAARPAPAPLPALELRETAIAAEPLPAPPTTEVAEAPAPAPAPAVPEVERLAPGTYQHEINMEGQVRKWTTVVPPGVDAAAPNALMVVLHGVGGRGVDMRSFGFDPLAASPRVVMAYPDALGGAWNDGRPGADPMIPGVAIDDVRFLRLMIEATAVRTGTAPGRVAVVGFSNGAVMAGRVACELADTIAAVALVAGSGWQGFEQSCRPAKPVAVMTVAGSSDPIVPYTGGKVADWGAKKRGFVAPVEDFFRFWVRENGCATTDTSGGTTPVSESKGVDCRTGSSVVRYRVNSGGHEWFRAPVLDTTNTVWSFLSARFVLPR